MNWQPIDTAPIDGTPIFLAGGYDDNSDHAMESEAEKMRTACRAWWNDGDWIITLAEAGCVNVTRIDPTHWAPIEEPR